MTWQPGDRFRLALGPGVVGVVDYPGIYNESTFAVTLDGRQHEFLSAKFLDQWAAKLPTPKAPVVDWIDVRDLPHPTDATPFLAWNKKCVVIRYPGELDPNVTHWAPMPEGPQ